MKTSIIVAAVLGLMVQHSFGQGAQGAQITQRARELRDQNNVRQGVPVNAPPSAPASSTQPQKTATGAATSPAQIQQQNINKLKNDIATMLADPSASQDKIKKFATNLTAAARGPRKPTAAVINKLAESIGTALAGKSLESEPQLRLAQNLEAIVNGASLSKLQSEAYASDVQAILQVAGAKRIESQGVAGDAKAVLADFHK